MLRSWLSRNLVVACLGVALAAAIGAFVGQGNLASSLQLLVIFVALLAAFIIPPRYLLLATIVLLPFEFMTEWLPVDLPTNLVPADMALIAYAISALSRRLVGSSGVRGKVMPRGVVIAGGLAVLLLLLGVVSASYAGFSFAAIRKLGRVAAILVAVWATPGTLNKEDVQRGCGALIMVGALASGYAIVEGLLAMGGVDTRIWQYVGPLPRLYSGFLDPNYYAYFLTLVIPIALARVVVDSKARIRSFLALGLLLVAAVGTFSRGGAIGIAVGVLLVIALPALQRRRHGLSPVARSITISGLAIGAVGIVSASIPRLWSIVSERFSGAVQLSSDPTAVLRLRIWRNAYDLVGSSPWTGVGPGNFLERMGEANPDTAFYAHNSLLETTVEMGVPAGILLVLIAVMLLVATSASARASLRAGDNEGIRASSAVGLLGALVGGLAASFFLSNALFLPSTAAVLILLSAVWTTCASCPAGGQKSV